MHTEDTKTCWDGNIKIHGSAKMKIAKRGKHGQPAKLGNTQRPAKNYSGSANLEEFF